MRMRRLFIALIAASACARAGSQSAPEPVTPEPEAPRSEQTPPDSVPPGTELHGAGGETAAAAHAGGATAVNWTPQSPMQGSLALLRLEPAAASHAADSIVSVTAEIAGEPLHFERWGDGAAPLIAVVPVPLSASDSLAFTVTLSRALSGAEQTRVNLPVAPGDFQFERLTVAPRFSQPLASATAARVARERAMAREVSRVAHSTPRLWQEPFLIPRDSRITSGFGSGREFNGQIQSRHLGTDLAGAVGAPVQAANRGVVRLVGDFYYAGNAVYIDHGRGLVTAYFHMSQAEVAQGDTVERGQVIGRVGETGRVTGPHLHWVVRYGLVDVNPLSALELPAPAAAIIPSSAVDQRR